METLSLPEIAEKLARSLGHKTDCFKHSVPCNCGCGAKQADALTEYERWKRENGK
jgi:hypothetical protein